MKRSRATRREIAADSEPHVPVLLEPTMDLLGPRSGGRYVDCTLGLGGHAREILERSAPDGRLLALDADAEMLALARSRLAEYGDRVVSVHANFDDLGVVAREHGFVGVDGVLFDLGVSSVHFDTPERGFSFRSDAPLDMRLDRSGGPSAADLVNELSERDLADTIYRFGEEQRSRPIARAIVAARRTTPIVTTGQLSELVARVVPGGRINPATRTFQALRIAVNRELDVLSSAIRQAHDVLADGGLLAAISFHSLEDRIVKRYFVDQARPCTCPPRSPICICGRQPAVEIVTRKPVVASDDEIAANPRSRSATLRVARRIAAPV